MFFNNSKCFWCAGLLIVGIFSLATSGSMLLSDSLESDVDSDSLSSSSSLSSISALSDSSPSSEKFSSMTLCSSISAFGSTKPVIKSAKRKFPFPHHHNFLATHLKLQDRLQWMFELHQFLLQYVLQC